MIKYLLALVLLILTVAPTVRAQEPNPDYPTVDALEAAVVPASDPTELAQRFRGAGEIPPPPTTAQPRQVGDQEKFWIINSETDEEFQIDATLHVVGEHIYMWVENGAPVRDADLQALADAFDSKIYNGVRKLWGGESSPGIDGDTRLYGLFAYNLGTGILAYFASRNTYPSAVYPTSNQHEMFLFNLDSTGVFNLDNVEMESTIAHEFQHMIRANIQDNEDTWMNEGFSVFTELYVYQNAGLPSYFLAAPATQLNTWTNSSDVLPHYGAASLFIAYFYERYGLDALRELSLDPGTGLNAFDHVLAAHGEPDVNQFFADWVLANGIFDPTLDDGKYGYELLNGQGAPPQPLAVVGTYPYETSSRLSQYAADYYSLTNPSGASTLTVKLTAPDTVALLPTDAPSGDWMWYSNSGDLSDMTLTRAFDLTDVTSATLNYQAWYDIEENWDYGYVLVSTDDGAHWDFLQTPEMSLPSNQRSSAYGPGYTGTSDGWRDQSISLDAYAGQHILLRFELINDDAITLPGLAIDNIQIPEIGYSDDVENGNADWQAAGWLRIDNRLPQHVWVQVAQVVGDDVQVARWLAPSTDLWMLPLNPDATQILLAVSPFAPATTLPTLYTLTINAE